MASTPLSRRHFCALAGAGALALQLPGCGGDGVPAPDDLGSSGGGDLAGSGGGSCGGSVAAGAASSYAVGATPRFFGGGGGLFVARDAGGLYALSAQCTHQGCIVGASATRFSCPCHGATFDLNGEHPTFPAPSPLPHYAVCVDASGNVHVDPGKTVPASTRV